MAHPAASVWVSEAESRLDEAAVPVLLIHGLGSSATGTWQTSGWWRALDGAGLGWIAPDLRGHGAAAKPRDPDSYRLPVLAADLVALLDEMHVATVDLVGYSLGAHVALELASTAPSRVRRMVLGGVGSLHPVAETSAEVMRHLPADADRAAVEACLAGAAQSSTADVAEVRVPILLVAGADDSLSAGVEAFGSAFPDARVLRVPGRNHLTTISAPPFKSGVIDFLQANGSDHDA